MDSTAGRNMGWIHSEAATISPLFRFRAPLIFVLLRLTHHERCARRVGSVQNLSHFRLAERRPGPGSRGDGISHLLVLQQLDVQISLGRPRRAGVRPC